MILGKRVSRAQQLSVKIQEFVTFPLLGHKEEQGALTLILRHVPRRDGYIPGKVKVTFDEKLAQGFLRFFAS